MAWFALLDDENYMIQQVQVDGDPLLEGYEWPADKVKPLTAELPDGIWRRAGNGVMVQDAEDAQARAAEELVRTIGPDPEGYTLAKAQWHVEYKQLAVDDRYPGGDEAELRVSYPAFALVQDEAGGTFQEAVDIVGRQISAELGAAETQAAALVVALDQIAAAETARQTRKIMAARAAAASAKSS